MIYTLTNRYTATPIRCGKILEHKGIDGSMFIENAGDEPLYLDINNLDWINAQHPRKIIYLLEFLDGNVEMKK